MQIKKCPDSRERFKSCWMTHFCTELCISAQTRRLALFWFLLFVFSTFSMLLVNGQIDGYGGLWAPRHLRQDRPAVLAGWLWEHIGVACIEPVKLIKATNRGDTKVARACRDKDSMLLIFCDPEVVRQSNADPGVTLGFSELLQRCLTSVATGERCSLNFYLLH